MSRLIETLRHRLTPAADPTPPDAVVFQAAALLLSYPDAELLGRLDVIADAVAGTPVQARFAPLLDHLRLGPGDGAEAGAAPLAGLPRLQAFHVTEFDLSRRHALHLTFWTDGDTRRRGAALAEIKAAYRASGLVTDTGGELPDYLPMMLEFASADAERGGALLARYRASLEILRLRLTADALPHAGVLEAVCERLGGVSPATREEIQQLYGRTIPVESVGIDPLLPDGLDGSDPLSADPSAPEPAWAEPISGADCGAQGVRR